MQRRGSHKAMKCFFSSPWRISLSEGLLLHAEQDSAAAATQRWWRGPPEQTQCGTRQPGQASPVKFMTLLACLPTLRPLIGASGSTEWTLFATCLALLPFLLYIPILCLNICLSSSISLNGISIYNHLQTCCQLFILTGCRRPSKQCWVASGEPQVGVVLPIGNFVLSLCNILQLKMTRKHPGKTG